jgi:hypothetical protein
MFDSAISAAPLITPTVPSLSRGVQQITAPEEEQFNAEPVIRRNQLADLNRATMDLAVEVNRRNTPQEVIDKRSAPRYSIAEINEMDMDALRDRFEKLPPIDDRPGIMRVLDIIDLPRNLVANALTAIFAPELRREAAERGDRGAFGLPRVMGSDMLRAMGLNNRVVTAIGGFGIDIYTDPLSYIGAPIGGLAVRAGKAGTATFGRTGQKALMGGLKQVEKGGIKSIADKTVRDLFESTVQKYADELGGLSGRELRSGLSKKLLGDRGGMSRRTADIVLGTAGSGGDLATGLFRTVNNAADAADAAQVAAVKKFAEDYTLNRGKKLGGANAGMALAHIPFTDITVYGPAWTKSGKQAVLQRAIALAREGNAEGSDAFKNMQFNVDAAERAHKKMVDALAEREFIHNAEASGVQIDAAQDHLVGVDGLTSRLDKDMNTDVRLFTRAGEQRVAAEAEQGAAARIDEFNRTLKTQPDDGGLDRFSRQIEESRREVSEAIESGDPVRQSLAQWRKLERSRRSDSAAHVQARSEAEQAISDLESQGYTTSGRVGDELLSRSNDFEVVAWENAPISDSASYSQDGAGEAVRIKQVMKPAIKKDGVSVSRGQVVVEDRPLTIREFEANAEVERLVRARISGEDVPDDVLSAARKEAKDATDEGWRLSDEASSSQSSGKSIDPPSSPTARRPPEDIREGDFVQWTSQGAARFNEPQRVIGVDNGYAFFSDSPTGVPIEQLRRDDNFTPPGAPSRSVDYRRNTKRTDTAGVAMGDPGQVGLTAVAMLAKQDDALKGVRMTALDPSTVRIGDEFEIGDATVRVIDDAGDAVELEVTYPDRFRESAALPGVDTGGEAAVELASEGFTTRYVIPKTADNYIPANSETLKRRVIRRPETALALNRRRIDELRAEIKAIHDDIIAQMAVVSENGVFVRTTEMGDVLHMVEMTRRLEEHANMLTAQNQWATASEEISRAKSRRRVANRNAAIEAMRGPDGAIPPQFLNEEGGVMVDEMITALDQMAPDDARLTAYNRLRDIHGQQLQENVREWLSFSDADLDAATQVADAFSDVISSAQALAKASGRGVRQYLDSEALMLRNTATKLMGLGDDVAGAALADSLIAPFKSTMQTLASYGMDLSSRVATLESVGDAGVRTAARVGEGVSSRLGAGVMGSENGLVNMIRARAATTARVASRTDGKAVRSMMMDGNNPVFSKGLNQIATDHGVDIDDIEKLDSIIVALVAAREGGEGAMHWATKVDGTPSEAQEIITKALSESGILRGRDGLLDDLTVMADEWIAEMTRLGDGAIARGTLKTVHDNYIPTAMTQRYADAARTGREAGLVTGQSGGRQVVTSLTESFQKAKGTWEIRYRDVDGNVQSFLLAEARVFRQYANNLQDLNLTGDQVNKIQSVNKLVDDFEALYGSIDNVDVVNTYGRPLDPFALNRLAKEEGAFIDLTGQYVGDMWQTRASDLLAQATQQHSSAIAKRSFADYVGQFGIPLARVNPATGGANGVTVNANGLLQGHVTGAPIPMADGTVAHVVDNRRIRIGDRMYRTIDTTKLENLAVDPFEGMFEAGLSRHFYPEVVADSIERFAEQLQPDKLTGLLKTADSTTRLWRASTLAHASWLVTNALGNVFLGGMAFRNNFPQFAEKVGIATKIVLAQTDPQKLRELTFTVGGQTMNAEDLLALSEVNMITSSGRAAELAEHVLRNSFDQAMQEAALMRDLRNGASGTVPRGDYLKASVLAFRDAGLKNAVRAWFRLNGSIDDGFRLAAFMQYMDEGNDVAEAARKTRQAFFNFGDMTTFESKNLRALFPFYAWLRGSMPNMIGKLRHDPMYFAIMPKGFEAIEELFAGEEQVPRHRRPRWINETLGVQIGSDPETRKVLLAGTLLPQEQALQVLSGLGGAVGALTPGNQGFGGREFMDLFDFFLGQTGPVIKLPLEWGLGRETFSGRTIGPTSTEGDISLQEHVLGQVRWLRETGVGSVRDGGLQRAFEDGIGSGVGRLLIGGRLQNALQEDSRQYGIRRDMAEREEQIRRAFNLAQREGDQRAMLKARDQLMSLYRDAIRSGIDPKDIPKWAREDLMQLGVQIDG